ncbi:MAG: peptidyl-prolyl cis-trans isomerase [Myxococcales bacterium]|nr:peptidyl-prolyl cis-trans isomerase [Myxococcales bacterium]
MSVVRRWLREPLVHFVALGALIFALDRARGDEEEPALVITDAFVEGLRHETVRSTGAAARDEDAVVRGFLREEALVREAARLGLAEGDVIVRRRLAQKMEFLLRSTAPIEPPTDAQLFAFLRAHPGRYRLPARVRYRHVFFDRRARRDPHADARAALDALRAAPDEPRPEAHGDLFLGGYAFPDADPRRVEVDFGADFVAALRAAPLGEWSGPVDSAVGVHLVRVDARRASEEPALADVHAQVSADWEDARRDEALEAAVRALIEALPVERRREPG